VRPGPVRVAICGGGVIGAAIAYFLSTRGVRALVIERAGIGNAASGKSGGFLALDWCRGTPVDPLARRSFELHAQLAERLGEELGLEWGYRRLDTLSVVVSQARDLGALEGDSAPGGGPNPGTAPGPDWLAAETVVQGRIGTEATTAQLHPALFTQGLMAAAEAGGAEVVKGEVEGIVLGEGGSRATGVVVDGETLQADAVVVAMGPWSILACQWLPLPAVYGLKGHSLLFRYEPEQPRALFVELETKDGRIETPEIMPRTDGTTYVCGLSSEEALPVDPADVRVEVGAPEQLQRMTAVVAPDLGAAEVLAAQACFRPVTMDGMPVIGAVPDVAGAYVATGHSVWGMLNAPATGEAVAELIVDGDATTVDIAPFRPERLEVLDPRQLGLPPTASG